MGKKYFKIGIFTTAGKYILKFLNRPDHMSDVWIMILFYSRLLDAL